MDNKMLCDPKSAFHIGQNGRNGQVPWNAAPFHAALGIGGLFRLAVLDTFGRI